MIVQTGRHPVIFFFLTNLDKTSRNLLMLKKPWSGCCSVVEREDECSLRVWTLGNCGAEELPMLLHSQGTSAEGCKTYPKR